MWPVPKDKWCPPCYPGSPTLPPVICRSYTGRGGAGVSLGAIRGQFIDTLNIGRIDAPDYLPAGSHCSPLITCNGKPVLERPHLIFPAEIMRGAA